MIIAGDFNMTHLSWPIIPNSPYNENILESILEGNLNQLITKPTRIRQNQAPSQTDLIFTNDLHLLTNIEYLPPLGKSDHLTIASKLQIHVTQAKNGIIKRINRTNYDKVRNDLALISWNSAFNSLNTSQMWKLFETKLSSSVKKHTSTIKIKVLPQKPWINHHLLKLIKQKKRIWEAYKRSPSENKYLDHRRFSNHVVSELKKARKIFEDNLAKSESSKKFYKYIRSSLSTKVGIPLLRKPDGNLCLSNKETADLLADEFHSNYSLETYGPFLKTIVSNRNSLSNIIITEAAIKETFQEIAKRQRSRQHHLPGYQRLYRGNYHPHILHHQIFN